MEKIVLIFVLDVIIIVKIIILVGFIFSLMVKLNRKFFRVIYNMKYEKMIFRGGYKCFLFKIGVYKKINMYMVFLKSEVIMLIDMILLFVIICVGF